jgi:hypothetical protein
MEHDAHHYTIHFGSHHGFKNGVSHLKEMGIDILKTVEDANLVNVYVKDEEEYAKIHRPINIHFVERTSVLKQV